MTRKPIPVDEDELERSIGRALRGEDRKPTDVAPDPYDIQNSEADAAQGRDRNPDWWRSVMENHNFRFFSPSEMDALIGMRTIVMPDGSYGYHPHKEGQWRCPKRRMAFTIKDLAGKFRAPEDFAAWIDQKDLEARARSVGLKLPAK